MMICNARSVWLNGRLYVGGGYNRLGSDAQLLIYISSNITWFGDSLLAIGGLRREDIQEEDSSVYAFNHQAMIWEHISDLPGGGCLGMCCAVLPNGELLVSGGVPADRRVLKATIRGKHCTMCVLYVTVLPGVNVLKAKDSGTSLLKILGFWPKTSLGTRPFP